MAVKQTNDTVVCSRCFVMLSTSVISSTCLCHVEESIYLSIRDKLHYDPERGGADYLLSRSHLSLSQLSLAALVTLSGPRVGPLSPASSFSFFESFRQPERATESESGAGRRSMYSNSTFAAFACSFLKWAESLLASYIT